MVRRKGELSAQGRGDSSMEKKTKGIGRMIGIHLVLSGGRTGRLNKENARRKEKTRKPKLGGDATKKGGKPRKSKRRKKKCSKVFREKGRQFSS